LYRRLFIQGTYTWFYKSDVNYNFDSFSNYFLELIKERGQGRILVKRQLSKGIRDLKLWFIQLFYIPLTFLVDFSKESTRIPPIHNWITPLTTVGFSQLILMIEGLKAFLKVIHKCLLMVRFYYLRFGLFLSNDLRSNLKENFIMF
jgi:hypothetical protein